MAASTWAQQLPPVPPAPIPNQPGLLQPAPRPAAPPPTASQAPAAAIQPAGNPVCVRLQAELAAFDQGGAGSARADQIKRSEDAIAKQQGELDRTIAEAHKAGCAGQGFLALFSALSPQCGPISSRIQDLRGNLDRMISDLERLKSGSDDRQGQRRAMIGQLAQNNCGAQYTAAANEAGPAGFFDKLFGGA